MISAGLRLLDLAPRAQRRDALLALGERLCEEGPLPGFRAHFLAERLYSRSSVHSASPCVRTVFLPNRSSTTGSSTSCAPLACAKAGPKRKVAVTVHDEDARAAAGAFCKGRDDLRVERIPDVVVARPVLEQVAEDVEVRGLDGALAEKLEKDLIDPGRLLER